MGSFIMSAGAQSLEDHGHGTGVCCEYVSDRPRLRQHARARDRTEQHQLGIGGTGSWAASVVKAKQSIEPTAEALLAAIDGYRDRARAAGRTVERVVATYEASWSGFWLARWLLRRRVETYVIQPSSVPVDRRARRAKSDGIDAELLLRTLLAWLRGEPRVCSMGPIPDETDEDERRRVREREDLLAERVSLVKSYRCRIGDPGGA